MKVNPMRTIILFLFLLCSCSAEDDRLVSGSSSSSSGFAEASTSTGDQAPHQADDEPLASLPDEQEACAPNWCASGGGGQCQCACSTSYPYEGTAVCCDGSFSGGEPVNGNGGCDNGKKLMQCKKVPVPWQLPSTTPPDRCSPLGYSCPPGYYADNITPGGGCDVFPCEGSCTGNANSCAAGYCQANL